MHAPMWAERTSHICVYSMGECGMYTMLDKNISEGYLCTCCGIVVCLNSAYRPTDRHTYKSIQPSLHTMCMQCTYRRWGSGSSCRRETIENLYLLTTTSAQELQIIIQQWYLTSTTLSYQGQHPTATYGCVGPLCTIHVCVQVKGMIYFQYAGRQWCRQCVWAASGTG